MLKYDITKTGKENILPLLNASAKEGVVVTASDVAFGAVSASTDQAGANSKITLTVVEGSTVVNGESPELVRHYVRLDLEETLISLGVDSADIVLDRDGSDADHLAAFVAASGIKLETADVVITKDADKVTFTMAADHYGLIGSSVVNFPAVVLPTLDEVFTEPALNGFADPTKVEGKRK